MPSAAVVAQSSSSSSSLSSSPAAAATGAIIATPTTVDILCGKDRECHDFVGSQRYRWLIETYRHKYANAGTRLEKMAVTMEIYSLLQRTNSRFLRYNEDLAGWEEVPFLAARDKIGHALRFANRTTRRRDKKTNTTNNSNNSQDTKVVEQYQPQQQEYVSNPYNALQDQITAAVMNVQSPFAALSSASGPTNSSMSKQQQSLERSLIYAPPSAVTVSFLQQKQKEAADRNAPTMECSWQHHGMNTNMNMNMNMAPPPSKNPNSFSVFPSSAADHNEVTNMPPPQQLVPSRVAANVERIRSATAASGNSSGPEPLWLNTKGPAGGRSPKNLAFAAALKLVQAAQQDHQVQAALTRAPQDMQQQQQQQQLQAPQNVSSWNATPQQHKSPQVTPSEDMRHSNKKNHNQVINNNIHLYMSLEQPSVQGTMGELGEVRSRIETQHRRGTTTTVESQTDAILQDSRLAFKTSLNHKSTEVTPSATLWHYSKTSPKQDENQNKKSCSCHHAYPPLPFIILAPDENPNLDDDYNPFHFFAVQENANPGPCCCHEDHPTESSSSSDDDDDSMTGSEHWSIVRDFVDDLDLDLEASISY